MVVVGGGIVGIAVARALAVRGQRVALVERAKIGREASFAAAGMLAPQAEVESGGPFLDLCIESRDLYPSFVEELYAETGVDVWYRNDGSFHVAFDDEEAARLERDMRTQRELGLECELLAPSAARRAEPALAANITAVLSIPNDHQVDNRRLVDAALLSCYAHGVEVVENTPVRSLRRDAAGRVVGVETTAGQFEAETVVVAAGCWSNLVADFEVPVEPVKGQMLMLELGAPPFRRVVRTERCYAVARVDGRVLVGATMERVGFDKSVSPEAVGTLLEAGREVVPSLANAVGGEAWAGLRPATPDGLPAIGSVEEGLIAATGHFRNGILLAPVTARIVAGIVHGEAPHPSAMILDPRRFAPATGRL